MTPLDAPLTRYRYEIKFLTPLAAQVSDFMNKADFPGRYGVQTEVITFSSDADKTPAEFRDAIKEGYESAGGEVLDIIGGEVV